MGWKKEKKINKEKQKAQVDQTGSTGPPRVNTHEGNGWVRYGSSEHAGRRTDLA